MFKSNHYPQRNRKTNPCIRCRKHYLQNALRTSGLPELIYIKCRICKYRYMPDRLRRFKAEFFQALAHPTRIAILEQLHDGELAAGAIIERLSMEQANVSHTLLFSGQNKS
jgi:Helix-turn-helix domain